MGSVDAAVAGVQGVQRAAAADVMAWVGVPARRSTVRSSEPSRAA
jgi:hypothetical protein